MSITWGEFQENKTDLFQALAGHESLARAAEADKARERAAVREHYEYELARDGQSENAGRLAKGVDAVGGSAGEDAKKKKEEKKRLWNEYLEILHEQLHAINKRIAWLDEQIRIEEREQAAFEARMFALYGPDWRTEMNENQHREHMRRQEKIEEMRLERGRLEQEKIEVQEKITEVDQGIAQIAAIDAALGQAESDGHLTDEELEALMQEAALLEEQQTAQASAFEEPDPLTDNPITTAPPVNKHFADAGTGNAPPPGIDPEGSPAPDGSTAPFPARSA